MEARSGLVCQRFLGKVFMPEPCTQPREVSPNICSSPDLGCTHSRWGLTQFKYNHAGKLERALFIFTPAGPRRGGVSHAGKPACLPPSSSSPSHEVGNLLLCLGTCAAAPVWASVPVKG